MATLALDTDTPGNVAMCNDANPLPEPCAGAAAAPSSSFSDQQQQQEQDEIDAANELAAGLPSNYHFELVKTVARIKEKKAQVVALQFPEGLLMFSVPIADILEAHTGARMIILGDVTYGACCVDDLTAQALGADFLVHYGHSCLVSIKDCCLKNMMYVFVEIDIDVQHLVDTMVKLIPNDAKLLCCSTIQFVSSMRAAVSLAQKHFSHTIAVPQQRPLSGGELLGCTSPLVSATDFDYVLYVGDGRFHLESFMIQNPAGPALQYDPYKKVMTREQYDIDEMLRVRGRAMEQARDARSVGLIMGTLGRQGNRHLVQHLREMIEDGGKRRVTLFLMSEIFPQKLTQINEIDCFVQVACPRLSIDWGYAFHVPLLSPFECAMVFGKERPAAIAAAAAASSSGTATGVWDGKYYPMEHYAKSPSGSWGVYATRSSASILKK